MLDRVLAKPRKDYEAHGERLQRYVRQSLESDRALIRAELRHW